MGDACERDIRRAFDRTGFDKHVAELTQGQKDIAALITDWVRKPRRMLIVVSGGPGTGKTYAVRRLCDYLRLPTLPMAYTAKIAHNIGGRTIHSSLRLDWKRDSVLRSVEERFANDHDVEKGIREGSEALLDEFVCPRDPLVVVVDEVAMIPYYLSYALILFFLDERRRASRRSSPAPPILMIVMGDRNQLLPVASTHNLFGLLRDEARRRELFDEQTFETHLVELTESKRFASDYEPVVRNLREYVDAADADGMLEYVATVYPIGDIDAPTLDVCTRALAFKNATVDRYNAYHIGKRTPGTPVQRVYRIDPHTGTVDRTTYLDLKPECRVFVTQNGCSEAVNGTLLVFREYCGRDDVLHCRRVTQCDTAGEEGDDRGSGRRCVSTPDRVTVRRNTYGSFPLALAFASTVHKFQGETLDDTHIAINFDGSRDVNLIYTALSRVRSVRQVVLVQLNS